MIFKAVKTAVFCLIPTITFFFGITAANANNQAALSQVVQNCDYDGFELLSSQGGYDAKQYEKPSSSPIASTTIGLSPLTLTVRAYFNNSQDANARQQCKKIAEGLIRQGANPFATALERWHLQGALLYFNSHDANRAAALEYINLLVHLGKLDFKKGIKFVIVDKTTQQSEINAGLKRGSEYDRKKNDELSDLSSEPTLLMLLSALSSTYDGRVRDSAEFSYVVSQSNVNARNKAGKTALMYSVKTQDALSHTKVLLESGADPTIKDSKGKAAIDYAMEYGNIEAAKLIKSSRQQDSQPSATQAPEQPSSSSPSPTAEDYSGFYSGTYSGKDQGVIEITLNSDGTASGSWKPHQITQHSALTGSVDRDGNLRVRNAELGFAFAGSIRDGKLTGKWRSSKYPVYGDFQATKSAATTGAGNTPNPLGSLFNVLQQVAR